jgi:hypothetical protein
LFQTSRITSPSDEIVGSMVFRKKRCIAGMPVQYPAISCDDERTRAVVARFPVRSSAVDYRSINSNNTFQQA